MPARRLTLCLLTAVCALAAGSSKPGITDTSDSPHVKIRSTGIQEVHWTDGFWADRFKLAEDVMLPSVWQVMQLPNNGASYRNFQIAAGSEQGNFASTNWSDGDVYKWLEGAAHIYAATHDVRLDGQMDEVISTIGKAQAPDGYLSTQIQLTGKNRWSDLHNHELYNMGHLLTAACIHYRATGKDSLLKLARRTADYLYTVFVPPPPELAHFGFNPSQIMGLVELYRTTGESKYLKLADVFVTMRGSHPGGSDLNQSRTPLRQETEAVGHAVTAAYLYAGATDVYQETGESTLWSALSHIWDNMVTRRMYVTGATGATRLGLSSHRDEVHEAFGGDYELPNRLAYNETCANIANAMWNWRMLGTSGDSRYADVMEQVLYNSMLSGVSVSGEAFFYSNPLRRFGEEQPMPRNDSLLRWTRPDDTGASRSYCCPPNVLRMLASMHEYAYGISERGVHVILYGSNTLASRLPGGGAVRWKQESGYPWDGRIRLTAESEEELEYSVYLRVPGWASGASLKVNGKLQAAPAAGSFTEVRRPWRKGDVVELELPMETRLVESNPLVEETRGQVAVMRGPVVYCLESPDLPVGVNFSEVAIPASARFRPRYEPKLLGGVTVLEGSGSRRKPSEWSGLLYRSLQPGSESVPVRLIPYYAWANRGISYMTVWMPLDR